jgi:hypothetical protein
MISKSRLNTLVLIGRKLIALSVELEAACMSIIAAGADQ